MARKKRRRSDAQPGTPRKEEPFHTPFGKLGALLRDAAREPPAAQAAPAPAPPRAAPPAPEQSRQSAPPPPRTPQEGALFLAEMAGVKPLPSDPRGRLLKRPQPHRRPQRARDDLEVLTDLQELVDGRGTFYIQYTDEYMEGVAPNIDRHLAQRLHKGDFAIQGHLDLHGYTVDEAREVLERFLLSAYGHGRRCVRLVHGRGRNSIDNRPVLKESVYVWLSRGRLSRLVLAFATAPLTDGGAGAVYVLLRRSPGTSGR